MQKSLGIDRPTRDRRHKGEAGADTVAEIVIATKEWMDTQLIQVDHCGIKLGWLWLAFPELWETPVTTCPRCNQELRVEIPSSEIQETPHIE